MTINSFVLFYPSLFIDIYTEVDIYLYLIKITNSWDENSSSSRKKEYTIMDIYGTNDYDDI